MNKQQVLDIFRSANAILEGHFILSSGRHSPIFLQKTLVFREPKKAEILCKALADKIKQAGIKNISQIVSPAIGGIIPGYEVARQMGLPAIYTERVNNKFTLRRGFEIKKGERVIIVEDIISTGLSIKECIKCVQDLGANIVAGACLIDRSGGEVDIGVPLISLIEYKVPSYTSDNLPKDLAKIPPIKPGSRGLA